MVYEKSSQKNNCTKQIDPQKSSKNNVLESCSKQSQWTMGVFYRSENALVEITTSNNFRVRYNFNTVAPLLRGAFTLWLSEAGDEYQAVVSLKVFLMLIH